jgi:hypothetical protein
MKRAKRETKQFSVSFSIKGSMIDKDTALTVQSLEDFIELHFSHREDCKISGVKVQEAAGE